MLIIVLWFIGLIIRINNYNSDDSWNKWIDIISWLFKFILFILFIPFFLVWFCFLIIFFGSVKNSIEEILQSLVILLPIGIILLFSYYYIKKIKIWDFKSSWKTSLQEKIEGVGVSNIESIKLIPNNYPQTINIQIKNFYKIVIFIVNRMGKTEFYENELKETYDYILHNYNSTVSDDTYLKITDALNIFVKNGWRIDIKYK